jgi:hypothetical protein
MGKINSTETKQIRDRLISRNLYTPDSEYSISNSKITEAINGLASLLAPTNSFDFKNSIIGRQLEPQTPLTKIANSQLAAQLQYQIGSNAKRELVPTISISNLLDKNSDTKFIKLRKDFTITNELYESRALNFISDITGYSPPVNPFVYSTLYGLPSTTSQKLFDKLGSGQKDTLVKLLNHNYYSPTLEGYNKNLSSSINRKYFTTSFSATENRPTLFGDFSEYINEYINLEQINLIKEIGTEYNINPKDVDDIFGVTNTKPKKINVEADNNNYGFNEYKGIDYTSNELHWGINDDDTSFKHKTGLLYYTKNLIKAIDNNNIDQRKKEFNDNKGNIVGYNGSPADPIRQHTVLDQYNRNSKLIRFEGNKNYDGDSNSVINKTVFPKIHPIMENWEVNNSNLFFSIENLAYQINENGDIQGTNHSLILPTCERGQQGGRLMWFAPYDVQFNETSTAGWDSTSIIGRGEPLHSYSSTERTGVLAFKMIVDYPQQIKDMGYGDLVRFFAKGDNGAPRRVKTTNISELIKSKIDIQNNIIKPTKNTIIKPTNSTNDAVVYFFQNAESTIDFEYEDNSDNLTYSGLNANLSTKTDSLIDILKNINESEYIKLQFIGYTSKLASTEFNNALGLARATELKDYIESEYILATGKEFSESNIEYTLESKGETSPGASEKGKLPENINVKEVKKDRRAIVNILYNDKTPVIPIGISAEDQANNDELQSQLAAIDNQIKIGSSDCNTLDARKDNLSDFIPRGWQDNGIFKPAFHSQTPEDYHKRLTFLHQCTRQGVAIENNVINSVFGRQPVCVLRLGDFLHTQIIIDSINFDFTEAMWDMNPEGMGMQYMTASITMNIKILGGQSLGAPISRLQNALSFNYFANSTYYKTGSIYEMTNKVQNEEIGNINKINTDNETAYQKSISSSVNTTPT